VFFLIAGFMWPRHLLTNVAREPRCRPTSLPGQV